jgi:very-short-patch-repair endonuclease
MRQNQLHNLKELKEKRKELRAELTSAEAFLWKKLQNGKLEGRKFRRQHSVGVYVLDFYCPSEKLAIELDGMPHFTEEGIEKDEERTKFLNLMGIRVIRFESKEVFLMIDVVLERIRGYFKK